jgi:F420-non-reducing hydrogenase iron-sulfur subunit
MSFEPKIVGILCNWCSYAGADLAGTARVPYAPNVRIVRVMCSGRVDPTFVLKALQCGADGVLIAGCHPGDCHYQSGNYKAMRRHALLLKVLGQLGVEPERVRLEWVSASEGERFAQIVDDMTEKVRALGPFAGGNGAGESASGGDGDAARTREPSDLAEVGVR